MHVPGRNSARHMKGKQIALTLYLPPNKYWLLKALSHKSNMSMQSLLRAALDQVLTDTHRNMQYRLMCAKPRTGRGDTDNYQ